MSMRKEIILKIVGVITIILLVLNLVLFILGKINGLVFFGVLIVVALFAFKVLPKLNK